MTHKTFTAPLYDGDTIKLGAWTATVRIEHDSYSGAPWENEDGHGPVSDWRHINYSGNWNKLPGELVISRDRDRARFYDFATACKLARADGWGFAPEPMTTARNSGGKWHAWFGNGHSEGCNVGGFDSQHDAIRALYDAHRSTMTARQYAAAAAMSDYNRLKAWCDDQWYYVGIIVTITDNNGNEIALNSVWGFESDDDSLHSYANDILTEALDMAQQAVVADKRTIMRQALSRIANGSTDSHAAAIATAALTGSQ